MSDERRDPLSELDAVLGDGDDVEPVAPDPLTPISDEGDEGRPGRLRRIASRIPGWVAPVLVLILAASTGAFAYLWQSEVDEGAVREEVREVAQRFTENLITFDHRTLESDIDRIRRDATGSFQGDLDVAFGGDIDAFRQALREAEAQSSGTVLGVILRSVQGDTARALAIADQRIENTETPEPQTIQRRIELTLVETADGWKVDRVDASGGLTGGG